jgi:hypothetical protein
MCRGWVGRHARKESAEFFDTISELRGDLFNEHSLEPKVLDVFAIGGISACYLIFDRSANGTFDSFRTPLKTDDEIYRLPVVGRSDVVTRVGTGRTVPLLSPTPFLREAISFSRVNASLTAVCPRTLQR